MRDAAGSVFTESPSGYVPPGQGRLEAGPLALLKLPQGVRSE
jgi:hypothetical protein